jgi:hypothetical protein
MRGRSIMIWGVCALGVLIACGGSKKEAKDPSDDKPYEDEVPKWEGATNPRPEDPPSKASTSSGGTVNEAPAKRSDQYDKEATEMVLKRAARQVKDNCGHAKDDNGKAVGPWGKATIQIVLGSNGHSKGTTIPEPFQGKPTGNCVEKAFANLTFPPWHGQDAQIDWEVEIVEPGKEKK